MTGQDKIRDVFFEECGDLLDALTEGLDAIANGEADDEVINAVFRAVHSMKGGGGAFGLDDLVGFAHVFETVLDRIRSKALALDEALIRLLQRAGDVLADLVEAAQVGAEIDAVGISATADALEAILGDGGAVEADFVFEAVPVEFMFDDLVEEAPLTSYTIVFTPERGLYAAGNEPLVLIRALEDLGPVQAVADVTRLPDFNAFDWEESYLSWVISLVTAAPEDAIRDVFEFVEGLCRLTITVDAPVWDKAAEVLTPDPAPDSGPVMPNEAVAVDTTDRHKEPRTTLRVDVDRIDRLINAAGELIINQAILSQRIRDLGIHLGPELANDLDVYRQYARDIQEGVMGLRTQSVKQLFQRMARIARETTDVAGKSARLVITGEETEVDKKIIEKLADPLTHMIRNAIDHGIETPEKRREVGKPEEGVISLTARYKSGEVLIEIADDGAGLNRPRVRKIAEEKGLIAAGVELSDAEINNLLFLPGFSTASSVTSLSGRGVGMDVVKTAIKGLGGRISFTSTPGKGSVFAISLPLTLAVLDGMLVQVGGETMVLPISCIKEVVRPRKRELSRFGAGRLLFASRGDFVPVVDLATQLGRQPLQRKVPKQTLLLVYSNGSRMALAVDQVIGKRQVVIKSVAKNYRHVPGISAATILGDGKVALIVDPDAITEVPTRRILPQFPVPEGNITPIMEEAGHVA